MRLMSQIWLQESKKVLESCFILAISRNQVFFFPLLCYSHNSNNSYIDVVARFGYRTGRTVILFLFVILLIFGDLQQQAHSISGKCCFQKFPQKMLCKGCSTKLFFSHSCEKLHNKENTARNSLSKYGDLHLFFLKIWQPAHIFSRKNPLSTLHTGLCFVTIV